MELSSYLKLKGIRPSAFAGRIGRAHTTVLRWLDGTNSPSREAIEDIFRETDGLVTASDLFNQTKKRATRRPKEGRPCAP